MDQNCDLTKKTCLPCQGGIPPLQGNELSKLHARLKESWDVTAGRRLAKTYFFPDFKSALAFTLKVGDLAEREGHHPDIHLSFGKATITTWTHKIDGLSESDFILAAKCDELYFHYYSGMGFKSVHSSSRSYNHFTVVCPIRWFSSST
jgi:4a-hydroxytetrahydrobiopterin dehydratase